MTTIGVVLSGAGYLDGAEIQEAVLCLLALDEIGATVKVYAPDMGLSEVDHLSNKPTGNARRVLQESARIARGEVEDLVKIQGSAVDGWIFPGGFGAAKNLCDFATQKEKAQAHKEVARVVREALAAQVPVGACCIAPALLACITKNSGPHLTLTIGNDKGTAKAISAMGATHVEAKVTDVVLDVARKVVTSPAYMYGDARLSDVAKGINKMVAQVFEWAKEE